MLMSTLKQTRRSDACYTAQALEMLEALIVPGSDKIDVRDKEEVSLYPGNIVQGIDASSCKGVQSGRGFPCR